MSIDKDSLSKDIVRQTIKNKLEQVDLLRQSQTKLQLACRLEKQTK